MKINFSKTIIAALTGAILLISCQQETINPKTENPPDKTENPTPQPEEPPKKPRPPIQESSFVTGANNFTFRLFAALRNKQPDQNLFISPLGLSSVLTMVFNGADGTTKEAMRKTLDFGQQTDAEINQLFKELQATLDTQDKTVTFTSVNALWYDQIWQLQPDFVQLNKNYFGATVQAMDFNAPETKNTMNNWAKEKTQGKIDKVVTNIPEDAVMLLINAIYFKATWTYPFETHGTRKGNFRKADGSTMLADFMIRYGGKFLYYHDTDKTVLDIPYGNTQFSMTLVMPNDLVTITNLSQTLSNTQLNDWLNKSDTTRMVLRMPRFKIEYGNKLNDALTQLGMGEAFSDKANFSRMLTGGQGSKLSELAQKTFVVVNEEGTEAAAVTTAITVPTSAPPTIMIDRPFIFLIREKSTNAIIFMGQLMSP
ncbi:serpin family protein [Adhaeribacter rhizoryzae]|uniref:Serpin family protein n=1 Tax=Adhaeribacter rhizoryzae TaxID=2607907 RepID=A0A5M6DMI5_9BACT|nr:serpin family protein [Adhaeribacter rhizoryzae]KAA5547472.1 serpin family protein [Adhaeribacter rhizoryzae]